MKILYIPGRSILINASSSIRNRAMINGFLENGHTVDVFSTAHESNHTNFDNSLIDDQFQTITPRVPNGSEFKRNLIDHPSLKTLKIFLYKIKSKLSMYDKSISLVNHIDILGDLEDYDVVITSSDPKGSHLVGEAVLLRMDRSKVKWIQIWGDPFFTDITRKSKLLNRKIFNEEKRLLSLADTIYYVSKSTLKEQKNLYPESSRKMFSTIIPFVEQEVYPDTKNEKLNILYTGDYYKSVRNISPLIESIPTNSLLRIIGNGDVVPSSASDFVKMEPRTSYSRIKSYEEKSDILVHLSNSKGSQIPGKIYQYSGTNKNILFILDGDEDMRKHFDVFNRFVFCENDPIDIKKKIDEITKGLHDDKRFVVEEFSPKRVTELINLDRNGNN